MSGGTGFEVPGDLVGELPLTLTRQSGLGLAEERRCLATRLGTHRLQLGVSILDPLQEIVDLGHILSVPLTPGGFRMERERLRRGGGHPT